MSFHAHDGTAQLCSYMGVNLAYPALAD